MMYLHFIKFRYLFADGIFGSDPVGRSLQRIFLIQRLFLLLEQMRKQYHHSSA